MADKYRSFAELAAENDHGTDFLVRHRPGASGHLLVGVHGGEIEPGTSEVAEAVAGHDHGLYLFEGLRYEDGKALHLTSTRFDEPLGLAAVAGADRLISVHGCRARSETVFLGGLDAELRLQVAYCLARAGFEVGIHHDHRLHGVHRGNVCNRNSRGAGVQIELSSGLRNRMFRKLSAPGRRHQSPVFFRFALAVRRALVSVPRQCDQPPSVAERRFALP